jgi:lactoylglutathione lyase
MKIGIVQINVTDMDVALEFYGAKLGFPVRSKAAYPDVVVLEHHEIPLILYKVAHPTSIDYPNVAQTLVDFEVEDIKRTISEFASRDVDLIHREPQVCPVGLYAAFRDPFGNVHELIEFQPKKERT